MLNTASDVMDFLNSSGIGLTAGTNLFFGPIRAKGTAGVPTNCVFVEGASGAGPERTMGDVSKLRYPLVHIRVRNAEYTTGDTLARAIMVALTHGGVSGYLDVREINSVPQPIGPDQDGVYLFLCTYELSYEDAA